MRSYYEVEGEIYNMSKKFSIVQSINLNKIHNEIDDYIIQNNCFEPYLFMSEETIKAITDEFDLKYSGISFESDSRGVKGTYTGYKVFINNDLKFGIVEIR